MDKYQIYKPSGVEWIGEIPSHWEINRLKWVTKIENSGIWGEDDEFPNSINVPIPTTGQLSIEGEWYYDKMNYRHLSKEDWNKYKCVEGDIVVVKSSGSSTNIITGKCGFISKEDSEKFGFSNFLLRVRPLKITPKLVYYFLSSNLTKQRIERMVSSTTYPNLKVDEYSNSELLIPPFQEQYQIVEFLDSKTELIERLISTKERKITLLKEQRSSIINQVVTKGLNPNVKMKDSGVEWIGEIPEGWSVKRVKYLLKKSDGIKIGPFGSSLKLDTLSESGIKVYGQGNVIKDDFTLGERYIPLERFESDFSQYEIQDGDVLITMMGTTGKCKVFSKDFQRGILDSHLLRLRFDKTKFDSQLFSVILEQSNYLYNQIKLMSKGSIMEGLNSSIVKELFIFTPSIQEQSEILQYLDSKTKEIDDLVQLEQNKIDLLKEYRQSLISDVVTGKIKVTN